MAAIATTSTTTSGHEGALMQWLGYVDFFKIITMMAVMFIRHAIRSAVYRWGHIPMIIISNAVAPVTGFITDGDSVIVIITIIVVVVTRTHPLYDQPPDRY